MVIMDKKIILIGITGYIKTKNNPNIPETISRTMAYEYVDLLLIKFKK